MGLAGTDSPIARGIGVIAYHIVKSRYVHAFNRQPFHWIQFRSKKYFDIRALTDFDFHFPFS